MKKLEMLKKSINLEENNNFQKNDIAKRETINNINYDEFDVTEEEKNKLIDCEQNIKFHTEKIAVHIEKFSKALYEANQVLANHNKNEGLWRKWLENVGIKKDKANMVIRKYKLFLQSKDIGNENIQILELPDRAIKKMTNNDTVFIESEITEIISSDNPKEKFRNLELKKNTEHKETKIFWQKELEKKEKQLNKIAEEIKKIKEKLQNL
ncbi:hypothetical protein [Parvimonas micra]|jgi:hypothetical protein